MKKILPPILIVLSLGLFLIIGFYLGTKNQEKLNTRKEVSSSPSNMEQDVSATQQPISTTKPSTNISPTNPSSVVKNYPAPKSWTTTYLPIGLNLCLPPKWEADQWGNIYFNRDPGYRPNVTYIQEIPYLGGSRRESFYKFWENEYPDVRKTTEVVEVNINGNTALKFNGPESEKIVWLANGKLWQAGISNWEMVNNSKTMFLKDFYTMISCSF
jgi:hypothetical protein